jgi:RHH-type proline utilization regulon transcriptional repressor/proline dehydrogenase/delta 1-pyrroline-5-carboxylate dehydrogenase
VTLSIEPHVDDDTKVLFESIADFVPGLVHPVEETDAQLADRISQGHVNRLRLLGSGKDAIIAACAEAFVTVVSDPVLVDGRIECLRYMDEQSISHDYHRYGNLGRRADEDRREVL